MNVCFLNRNTIKSYFPLTRLSWRVFCCSFCQNSNKMTHDTQEKQSAPGPALCSPAGFSVILFSYLGKQWAADRIHFSEMMEPPQIWPALDVCVPSGGEKRSESAEHQQQSPSLSRSAWRTPQTKPRCAAWCRGTHLYVHLPGPGPICGVHPTHNPVLHYRWSAAVLGVGHNTYM